MIISELSHNLILIIAVCTWGITQTLKVVVILVQEKRLVWSYFVTSGGMPSAHSATTCALATSIGMTQGLNSVFFSISLVLAIIVMYDAAGVRQSVGQHSVVLNRIVKEFRFNNTREGREQTFREFIGHTPFQVFVGAVLGFIIAWSWITLASH